MPKALTARIVCQTRDQLADTLPIKGHTSDLHHYRVEISEAASRAACPILLRHLLHHHRQHRHEQPAFFDGDGCRGARDVAKQFDENFAVSAQESQSLLRAGTR